MTKNFPVVCTVEGEEVTVISGESISPSGEHYRIKRGEEQTLIFVLKTA